MGRGAGVVVCANDVQTGDLAIYLGANRDTECQKEGIDDTVAYTHSTGSDISRSEFEGTSQDDVPW